MPKPLTEIRRLICTLFNHRKRHPDGDGCAQYRVRSQRTIYKGVHGPNTFALKLTEDNEKMHRERRIRLSEMGRPTPGSFAGTDLFSAEIWYWPQEEEKAVAALREYIDRHTMRILEDAQAMREAWVNRETK